jgi:hypothetical protein
MIKNFILLFFYIYLLRVNSSVIDLLGLKHSFEIGPGPTDRSRTRPTRDWNRAGLMKKYYKS